MDINRYQALGNDYFVILDEWDGLSFKAIKLLCDRHFGVGSDGVLCGKFLSKNKFQLKIYNSDGSIAEKSGNGIRIFAQFLRDHHYWHSESVCIVTDSGPCHCELFHNLIGVNMGRPRFVQVVPHEESLKVTLHGKDYVLNPVSMGNPHCVIFVDKLDAKLAKGIGPEIEKLEMFPQKTNVQFAKIISNHLIQAEIWERGSGYTLSSGSSSCAIFAVARHKGMIGDSVTVQMPGGNLSMEMNSLGEIVQYGVAEEIAEIHLSANFEKKLREL